MAPKFHSNDISQFTFLVTGGAGFIGSHLIEYLLNSNAKKVICLDNLSNGSISNVELFKKFNNYQFIKGNITNIQTCNEVCKNVDYVLHQAALGSVPRSVKNPLATHEANATGFINILNSAKENKIKRVVYASSSSVYGDDKSLPKVEENVGNPMSPYAVSKKSNELYAKVFYQLYGLEIIGLRYFNIFGPRQTPDGPYAAAIPIFITHALEGKSPFINGNGSNSRDFTYIENAVQANIKALFCDHKDALGEVFNIAVGERTTVLELYNSITEILNSEVKPTHREDRVGDIPHSLADISKAKKILGYSPTVMSKEGLKRTVEWYKTQQ